MYRVEIINVGMGDDDEEQSLLVLYSGKEKAEAELARLVPEYAESVDQSVHKQKALVRVVWIPKILLWLSVVGGIIWTAAQYGRRDCGGVSWVVQSS